MPEDVEKYDLDCYDVKENDVSEARSLKKARDAMQNDPFFIAPRNKKLVKILNWLTKEKKRCEQQSIFAVNPKDPLMPEKIILEKISRGSYI